MSELTPNARLRPRHWIVLFLILATAGFVRFWRIGDASLWLDEIWTLEIATGRGSAHDHFPLGVLRIDQVDLTSVAGAPPASAIWTHMTNFFHPPLYYLLLRIWMDIWGNGPAATRCLSAIFGLAAIAVFFDVCRLLHGPRVALLAAAIMAIAVGQIEMSQETRNYAMLTLCALCAADALLRIEQRGISTSRIAALAVSLMATALVHYFALGALVALGIHAILRLRGRERKILLATFAVSAVLTLAIWLPQVPAQIRSMPGGTPSYLKESPLTNHLQSTGYRLLGLPAGYFFGERAMWGMDRTIVVITGLATMILLARLWRRGHPSLWMPWAACIIVLMAGLDLIDHTTMTGYIRYTVLAAPAIFAAYAAFDWPRRTLLREGLILGMILWLAIAAWNYVSGQVVPRQDWIALAHAIDAQSEPDEPIIFFSPDPWNTPGMYYVGYRYYSPNSRHPWAVLNAQAGPALSRDISGNSLLLVGFLPPTIDPSRVLPGWKSAGRPTEIWPGTVVIRMVRS